MMRSNMSGLLVALGLGVLTVALGTAWLWPGDSSTTSIGVAGPATPTENEDSGASGDAREASEPGGARSDVVRSDETPPPAVEEQAESAGEVDEPVSGFVDWATPVTSTFLTNHPDVQGFVHAMGAITSAVAIDAESIESGSSVSGRFTIPGSPIDGHFDVDKQDGGQAKYTVAINNQRGVSVDSTYGQRRILLTFYGDAENPGNVDITVRKLACEFHIADSRFPVDSTNIELLKRRFEGLPAGYSIGGIGHDHPVECRSRSVHVWESQGHYLVGIQSRGKAGEQQMNHISDAPLRDWKRLIDEAVAE